MNSYLAEEDRIEMQESINDTNDLKKFKELHKNYITRINTKIEKVTQDIDTLQTFINLNKSLSIFKICVTQISIIYNMLEVFIAYIESDNIRTSKMFIDPPSIFGKPKNRIEYNRLLNEVNRLSNYNIPDIEAKLANTFTTYVFNKLKKSEQKKFEFGRVYSNIAKKIDTYKKYQNFFKRNTP